MDYRVRRGEQEFGPYSLSDLQEYVQSGNVATTDLAISEGMTDWMPISQVLGTIPVPIATPATDAVSPVEPVKLPPNLHWGWLLLIDAVTRSYFNFIWAIVQANWARKLIGRNTPLVLVVMYPAGIVAGGITVGVATALHAEALRALGGLLVIAGFVSLVVANFKIAGAMEEYYNHVEDIGMSLSGAMIFFFGTIYIQYHVNRLARWKKTGQLS
jgi:hypothetical protein